MVLSSSTIKDGPPSPLEKANRELNQNLKGHFMPKIKVSILSIIWLIYLSISNTPFIIPLFCAVILHEAGHLFCALLLGIKIKSIELSISGARIKTREVLSYINELLFALGGPFIGFVSFAFTFNLALSKIETPFYQNFLFPFSILSLCLSVFNLIPIDSLDGGRILKCLISLVFSLDIAEKIMRATSFLCLVSLWLLSVYMMLRMSNGVPMFVFCLIFFSKCFIFNIKSRDFESF